MCHKCCVTTVNPTALNYQHSILEILNGGLFELVKIKMHVDGPNLVSDLLN